MAFPDRRIACPTLVVAAALVILTACGTTGSTTAPPTTPTPTPTIAMSSPPVTPSSTPTTATPSPTASTPKLVTFAGGLNVSTRNVQTALSATSPAFQAFIAARLHKLWSQHGAIPGCEGSALIVLTAYRSDGYANASDEGMFGSANCASGGNSALYATVAGTWQEIAGTQSGYDCSVLAKYHVPSAVVGSSCLNSAGNPQPYSG